MKNLVIFSILLALMAGFAACKKTDNKSSACNIITFKDGDVAWTVGASEITAIYPKGSNVGNVAPVIEVSEKASVEPRSGARQDFSGGKEVTYVVTAEDGKTTKRYTAKATVE